MTEELLHVEDRKKAVYFSYLNCSLIPDSSVYSTYLKVQEEIQTNRQEKKKKQKTEACMGTQK